MLQIARLKTAGSQSDCGDVNSALADTKGPPTGNGIGGRCLMSVEAQRLTMCVGSSESQTYARLGLRDNLMRSPPQKGRACSLVLAARQCTSEGQAIAIRKLAGASVARHRTHAWNLQTTRVPLPEGAPVSNLGTAPIRRRIAASDRFRSAIDPRKTSVEMWTGTPAAGSLARAPCPRRQTTAPRRYRLSSSVADHLRTPH
jgi:hypothetical protein